MKFWTTPSCQQWPPLLPFLPPSSAANSIQMLGFARSSNIKGIVMEPIEDVVRFAFPIPLSNFQATYRVIPTDADGTQVGTCLTVLGAGAELKLMPRIEQSNCQVFGSLPAAGGGFRLIHLMTGQCLDQGASINGVVYQLVLRAVDTSSTTQIFRLGEPNEPAPLVMTATDGTTRALYWNDAPDKSWVMVNLENMYAPITTGQQRVALVPASFMLMQQSNWPNLGAEFFPRQPLSIRQWDGKALPNGTRIALAGSVRNDQGGNRAPIAAESSFLELAAPPPIYLDPDVPSRGRLAWNSPPCLIACRSEPWSNGVFVIETIDLPEPLVPVQGVGQPPAVSELMNHGFIRCLIRGANGLYLQLTDDIHAWAVVYASTALREDARVIYIDCVTSHFYDAGSLADYQTKYLTPRAGYPPINDIMLSVVRVNGVSIPLGCPIFVIPGFGGIAGDDGRLTVYLVE